MTTLAIRRQEDWTKPPLLVLVAKAPERCEVYEINLEIPPEWQCRTQNQESQ